MDTWRFVLGATIHAVILALAIVYAGERIGSSDASDNARAPSAAKTGAVPVNDAPRPASEGPELIEKIRTRSLESRTYGNPDSSIKLISYFDVQCTFCRRFYSVAKRAVDESEGAVSWSLRHYPLNQQSPSANWAKVPECMAEQKGSEGFFAFFDTIYLEEAPLNDATVSGLISSLGVDKDDYQECLDSGEIAERVSADINEGQSLGIQGTPTTVIYNESEQNAMLRMGAMPIEQLRTLIDQVK